MFVQVAKEGGEKWKLLSDDVSENFISVGGTSVRFSIDLCFVLDKQEKKVYTDRAAELKAEYQKASEAENEQVCS